MNKFYVTTAIDYTNEVIHIGHIYQKILADCLARWHRLKGEQVRFLTGTDEHGAKVAKAAQAANLPPKEYVDQIAKNDETEQESVNISFDRFIRTTDPDHAETTKDFYNRVKTAGDIYEGDYQGLYCQGCEGFLTENDLVDGKCVFHPNQEPVVLSEKNYFFKWSRYQKFLEEYIESHPEFIFPESQRKDILGFLKQGLKDRPISRPSVKWGLPFPDNSEHTIYVWFEALINYITGAAGFWPADVHVLGKDNGQFHALLWPAMLQSAGYPLPKTILIHSFIQLDGQKISKSLGNVIYTHDLVKQFGVDGVRYFFLRHGPLLNDVDITLAKIKEVYNADLANGLGNLVARIAKLAEKTGFVAKETTPQINPKPDSLMLGFRVDLALAELWQEINKINSRVDAAQPWKLPNEELKKFLDEIIPLLQLLAFHLQPFLPETSAKIIAIFSGPVKSCPPLFPRLV